jgi:hypothetical protein
MRCERILLSCSLQITKARKEAEELKKEVALASGFSQLKEDGALLTMASCAAPIALHYKLYYIFLISVCVAAYSLGRLLKKLIKARQEKKEKSHEKS